ncbi:MAG: DUF2059 domain-containing protein [Pyrinomonadaceae bacterium]
MQKTVWIFLALLIVASGASLAHAQDTVPPEKVALIKEIAELTGGKKQFDEIMSASMDSEMETFKVSFAALVQNDKHSPASDPILIKLMDESMADVSAKSKEFFAKQFSFDKFVNDVFVPVYAHHFTDDELRDLIAFYKTPTGQKLVRETPQMMVETMSATTKTLLPEFTKFMGNIVGEELDNAKKTLVTRPVQPKN